MYNITFLAYMYPVFQLIEVLKARPADDREIHGHKVSGRILKELTPQEIRDLKIVFELFDSNADG